MRTTLWTILFLVGFDLVVGLVTEYPADPRSPEISGMQRYFNYGRSIESKVRWTVGGSDEEASGLALTGWIEESEPQIEQDPSNFIALYGMSFTGRIGEAMVQQNPAVTIRLRGGPAATVSRSYADYLTDLESHNASVVVIGVLASSIPSSQTVTHMTWNFEAPSGHFYPRFELEGDSLERIDPPVTSLSDLRAALTVPERWKSVVSFMQENDPYYDRFSFNSDAMDRSILGRFVRRAWAQRTYRERVRRYYEPGKGFTNYAGSVDETIALLGSFADKAKERGQRPLVLLIGDQGYSDHLYLALAGRLRERSIEFLSSHQIISADNSSNFERDGHFKRNLDHKLARHVLDFLGVTTGGEEVRR